MIENTATVTATERKAIKRQAILAKAKSDAGIIKGSVNEPIIEVLNYKTSLVRALNYYNSAYENKEKKAWAEKYSEQTFSELPEYEFRSIGALMRLKARNQPLEDRELVRIINEVTRLTNLNTEIVDAKNAINKSAKRSTLPSIPLKEKLEDAANVVGAHFDFMLDDFRANGTAPNFSGYLSNNKVPVEVVALVPAFYASNIGDLKAVFNGDEELAENYAYMTRVQLRKYLNILESIKSVCDSYCNANKAITVVKPRKTYTKKVKPASVVAKNVKFMVESPELGIKSVLPSKIVGAKEVWVFNTRYRKLAIYRTADGKELSVKGTTIIGFDEALSSAKAIRKPEWVKELMGHSKAAFNKAYGAINTKIQAVTGRINEDCVIVKAA